jgi:hypothetical protein
MLAPESHRGQARLGRHLWTGVPVLDGQAKRRDQLRAQDGVPATGVRVEPDDPAALEPRGEDEPIADQLDRERD